MNGGHQTVPTVNKPEPGQTKQKSIKDGSLLYTIFGATSGEESA